MIKTKISYLDKTVEFCSEMSVSPKEYLSHILVSSLFYLLLEWIFKMEKRIRPNSVRIRLHSAD